MNAGTHEGNKNKGRDTCAVIVDGNDKSREAHDHPVPIGSNAGRGGLLADQAGVIMLDQSAQRVRNPGLPFGKQIFPVKINKLFSQSCLGKTARPNR